MEEERRRKTLEGKKAIGELERRIRLINELKRKKAQYDKILSRKTIEGKERLDARDKRDKLGTFLENLKSKNPEIVADLKKKYPERFAEKVFEQALRKDLKQPTSEDIMDLEGEDFEAWMAEHMGAELKKPKLPSSVKIFSLEEKIGQRKKKRED